MVLCASGEQAFLKTLTGDFMSGKDYTIAIMRKLTTFKI